MPRLILACLSWLLLWGPLPARAALLAHNLDRVPLAGQMSLLHDADDALTIKDILSPEVQQRFRPIPGNISAGYVKGNVWLRFDISRAADAPREWWLEIPNPLIDEVSLYIPSTADSPQSTYVERRAGEQVPPHLRDSIPYRQVVYRLAVVEEEPQTLYLRLKSVNALATQPTLWSEKAFTIKSSNEDSIFGGMFTLIAVITLTSLMVGIPIRERGILASAGFNISLMLILLPNEGFLQLYLAPKPGTGNLIELLDNFRAPDIFIGVGLALNFWFGWSLLSHQGGLGQDRPHLARIGYWVLGLILLPLLPIILVGDYGRVAPFMQAMAQIEGLITIALTSLLAWRGNPDARFFLFPYVTYILLSMTRLGRNLGWLPANALTEHAFHVGIVILAVSLAAFAMLKLRRMQREREQAQAQLLQDSQQNQRELEARVKERTAELTASIAEQRHLLAMVSHEFRNPLAVVDGAAQNLERGIGGTTALGQIRRATGRMTQLLTNVLAEDRLNDETKQMRRQTVDLGKLVQETVASRPPVIIERIRITPPVESAFVYADPHLLGIALDNLLDNALKYAPGGDLEIRITGDPLAAPGHSDAGWRLTVLDRGPGLPSDVDVFAKYVRGNVPASSPGAGLGLFLVARIAELHDGEAFAESRIEGGAQVGLRLPCAPETPINAMTQKSSQ
jgi:signal transduction histidine kinase